MVLNKRYGQAKMRTDDLHGVLGWRNIVYDDSKNWLKTWQAIPHNQVCDAVV